MFRIFVIIGGLIAALLVTAFIAPFFIDWSQYRTNFEQQASRIIGHQVTVKGKANARILPFPSLSFNEVEVRDEGDDTALLSVKKFSIFAELAPLLSGELHIIDMVLDEPTASAIFDINQQLNWTARNTDISAFDVQMDDVILKNITIKNGTIQIEDQANQHQHQLTAIDAQLSARSLLGPWHAQGLARYNTNTLSELLKFKMDTGVWSEIEKLMRLRLNIKPQNQPYQFKTTGIVNGKEPHLQYDGTFQFDALNNTALKEFAKSAPDADAPLPIALKGDMVVKPSEILLPNFDLNIQTQSEPYRINGNANITLAKEPRFNIKAEGRQVDIQRLKSELNATASKSQETEISFSSHLSNLQNFLKQIPHAPIAGNISISLPALTAGENIIRNLNLNFSQLDDGWDIEKFEAELPGRTKMRAVGKLQFDKIMNFQGDMIVASSQPTGLANWIKGKIDPKIRTLKQAGFVANVLLNDSLMRFDDLEVDVNGQTIKGNIVRTAGMNDARPRLQADLQGGTLDLNAMLAVAAMFTNDNQGQSALDHDIALELQNDVVVFKNHKAKNVQAELHLSNKNIDIEKFEIEDFAGTNVKIKGKLDNIFTSPDGQLSAQIKADNAGQFIEFLDEEFISNDKNSPANLLSAIIENPTLSQDADLNFVLDAKSQTQISSIKLDVKGMMAQTEITSNFSFQGDVQNPYEAEIKLTSSLKQNQPYILLQQLGLNALPVDLDMPAEFSLNLQGIAKDGISTQTALKLEDNVAEFIGAMLMQKDVATNFNGKITVDATDLQDVAFLSGFGIDDIEILSNNAADAAKAVALSTNAKGTFGKMSFSELTGKIYGNGLTGNLMLDRSKFGKPVVTGNLNFTHLSLPLLANWVYNPSQSTELEKFANPFDVISTKTSQAPPLWENAAFGTPFLQGFDGKISLTAKEVAISDNEKASLLNADVDFSNGDIALQNAQMLWREQSVSYNLIMKNTNKEGALRLSLAAQKMPLGKMLWQNTALNIPAVEGTSALKINIEASGKSALKMVKGLSGTAQINMNTGTLNNLNSGLLNEIFPIVDKDGVSIDATTVGDIASQLIYKTPYQFKMKPIEFTIAGGVARTSDIALHDENSTLSGDAKIDMINAKISGNATLRIDPKTDRIEGASPDIDFALTGALHAPNLAMDVTPLSNFLALRAFEIQRHKIETLQAEIAEKRRLKRAVLKTVAKAEERRRIEQQRLEEARKKEEERLILENAQSLQVEEKLLEEKQRKLKKLQLKYDKEINNRDGIEMEDLEQDGNIVDTW